MNGRPRLSAAQTRALKLVEVCACEVYPPDFETGMVVCWVCEMTVVQVFDDGIGPELVRSWMRLVRDQEETERAAMTVVRNQEGGRTMSAVETKRRQQNEW